MVKVRRICLRTKIYSFFGDHFVHFHVLYASSDSDTVRRNETELITPRTVKGLGLPKTFQVRENFSLTLIAPRKKTLQVVLSLFLFVTDLNGQQRLTCRQILCRK